MRSFMFILTVVAAALWLGVSDAHAFGRRGHHRGGCGGGCGEVSGCGGGCGYSGCGWGGGCGGGCGYAGGCGGGCGSAYAGGCGGGCGGAYAGGCGGGCGGYAEAGAPIMPGTAYATVIAPAQQPVVSNMGSIRLTVTAPEGAKLFVDDRATQSTSAQHVLESPPVPLGRDYQYKLRAEVTRNGQTYTVSRVVTVRPGQDNVVMLDLPSAVASR